MHNPHGYGDGVLAAAGIVAVIVQPPITSTPSSVTTPGMMHSWDVVNEVVNVPDGRPDGLRKDAALTRKAAWVEVARAFDNAAGPAERLAF